MNQLLDLIDKAIRAVYHEERKPPVALLIHPRIWEQLAGEMKGSLERESSFYNLQQVHGLPVTWIEHGNDISLRTAHGDTRVVR